MHSRLRLGLALCVSSLLLACNPNSKSVNSFQNPENQAPGGIRESFAVNAVPLSGPDSDPSLKADKARISLKKMSLEKEFLLQPNVVVQQIFPSFQAFQSRIVFFRQVDAKVYMIEASQGLTLAKDYPQTLIMAEFPVLAETPDEVTFDFNSGMKNLFMARDWHASDYDGGAPESGYKTVNAEFSYIERAVISGTDLLEIDQVAQLELTRPNGENQNVPVKAIYYLRPYKPNSAFTPTRAPRNFDRVGFFETRPLFNDQSGTTIFATKVDILKPVTYAISANTPSEFKDAVRDGILYWNKAFGKEVLKVVDAPADARAPDPRFNIVQWVDFEAGTFAYADANMDPRTGEILHQQIFMASGWTKLGPITVQRFGRINNARAVFGLNGFENQEMCDLKLEQLAEMTASSLRFEKDPAKIKKATADLIRSVMAHEVGHTLGLRHNFAGSLAANYHTSERTQLFKDYLTSGSTKADLVTASTVMDYQAIEEDMMHGDHIAKAPHAAEYDMKAIETLYFDKTYPAAAMPFFCTDSHVGELLDCLRGDNGNSHVEWLKTSNRDFLNQLHNRVLEYFIRAKTPLYGAHTVQIAEVKLNPELDALLTLMSEKPFLRILSRDSRLLSVERSFPYVGNLNQEAARAKTLEYMTNELAKHGGFDGVLINSMDVNVADLQSKFEALLNDPDLIRGIGLNGQPYEFSGAEIDQMRAIAKVYFKRYRDELIKLDARILAGKPIFDEMPSSTPQKPESKFESTRLGDDFADYLGKRMTQLITATSGDPIVFKRSTGSDWSMPSDPGRSPGPINMTETTYTLPQFALPIEVRKDAASFLKTERSEKPGWAYAQRAAIQKAYKALLDTAAPGLASSTGSTSAVGAAAAGSLNYADLPEVLINWIMDASAVQKAME